MFYFEKYFNAIDVSLHFIYIKLTKSFTFQEERLDKYTGNAGKKKKTNMQYATFFRFQMYLEYMNTSVIIKKG